MQTIAAVSSSRSRSISHFLWPGRIPQLLYTQRELIWQLTARSVASRYRGSVLGLLWSFVLPLVMLAVYTFVFSTVLKARWGIENESKTDFALTLFCGLFLYQTFADCIANCTSAIIDNVSYVKKVVFPLEILPIVHLGSALFNGFMSMLILLLGILIFQQRIPTTFYYFPLVALPLICLCLGLGWFLASVGVYLRDVGQVVAVILQMLIFLTPIFYPIERIPSDVLQLIMRLNPLSVIVENARLVLMFDSAPRWPWLIGITLFCLLLMQLGYVWFMKTKRGFADVL